MSSTDVWHYALALFLILTGVGLTYMLVRMGGTLQEVTLSLKQVMTELVPMLGKTSVTLDHVNDELGKVSHITDSAVDAADSLDHSVRAVSAAVGKPVKAASGFTAGVSGAFNSFKARRDQRGGVV